ncbi:hypothetical protein PSTG_04687 [Puccinia striiformis f. sp. tritici PST-78]|uniref:Uncharacterized protein n=1 Tax=Puccinia striiformis f. sp. tritici PST-78 TaxID=1165861 RepID=A0A0L0VT53_9BASI|nr:hypothetical protein PSTG_04687 [Puccinia striiformis f. sp. tritici PST-78]
MGLPCNHQIHQANKEGTQFTIDDFHQHWHIQIDLIPENHTEALPDSITAPTKENNEKQYLTDLFNQFKAFQPGKQKFYLGEINKLFEGGFAVAIEGPQSAAKVRGRPGGPTNKRNHKSKSSSKRQPSAFGHQDAKEKIEKGKILSTNTRITFHPGISNSYQQSLMSTGMVIVDSEQLQ